MKLHYYHDADSLYVEFRHEPSAETREIADGLRLHRLRAADALQLAAALMAASEDPSALEFVVSDERLSQAARAEGFRVR